jgi:hypothetical protein
MPAIVTAPVPPGELIIYCSHGFQSSSNLPLHMLLTETKTAPTFKIVVSWVVTPCSLVGA